MVSLCPGEERVLKRRELSIQIKVAERSSCMKAGKLQWHHHHGDH